MSLEKGSGDAPPLKAAQKTRECRLKADVSDGETSAVHVDEAERIVCSWIISSSTSMGRRSSSLIILSIDGSRKVMISRRRFCSSRWT
jgi:hypothetical protein